MKYRILLLLLMFLVAGQFAVAQKYFPSRWQDRPRNALLYLPRNFSPSENLPVVINMHGFLTNSRFQFDYTQFHKTADSVRCIVIYPDGIGQRWNSGTFFFVGSDVDDVGYLSDLTDRVAVLYNADMKKVYSMGYSAGGFMSYKLACDLTNRVAAIAPDVASMVNDNLSSCVPARPVSIAAFNGLSDPITPYAGFPGNFPVIDSIKHFWQLKNGCDVLPVTDTLPDLRNDGTRVVRYTYQNCNQNAQQVFYKVINGGHVWPGAGNIFLDVLGKTTQDISMNAEAWNFFKTKKIPAGVQCNAPADLQANAVTADSFQLSWTAVAGVAKYKIGIADDSDRVTFFETENTSLGVGIDPTRMVRWNVASLCSSGYHNWNTTRALNGTPTSVRNQAADKIAVFPNPGSEFIQLEWNQALPQDSRLAIYNVLGENVYSVNSMPSDNRLNIAQLAKGWYQLTIESKDMQYMAAFIKE